MGFDLGKATGGLFGSSDSMKRFSTLSRNQGAVDQRVADYLNKAVGAGPQLYQGQLVAGLSPYEQQGLGALTQLPSAYGSTLPAASAAYNRALGGQMLSPIDMSTSKDWYQNRVIPTIQKNLQQVGAPLLEAYKGMGGGVSSSGMSKTIGGMLDPTQGGLGQYIADQGYNYLLSEQQAQRDREAQNAQIQLTAMGQQSPQVQALMGQMAASQTYGALPRLVGYTDPQTGQHVAGQLELDANYQNWAAANQQYASLINQALGYISQQQIGTYMQSNPGVIGQVTGGLNQISQLGSAAFNATPAGMFLGSMPGQAAAGVIGSAYPTFGQTA